MFKGISGTIFLRLSTLELVSTSLFLRFFEFERLLDLKFKSYVSESNRKFLLSDIVPLYFGGEYCC